MKTRIVCSAVGPRGGNRSRAGGAAAQDQRPSREARCRPKYTAASLRNKGGSLQGQQRGDVSEEPGSRTRFRRTGSARSTAARRCCSRPSSRTIRRRTPRPGTISARIYLQQGDIAGADTALTKAENWRRRARRRSPIPALHGLGSAGQCRHHLHQGTEERFRPRATSPGEHHLSGQAAGLPGCRE